MTTRRTPIVVWFFLCFAASVACAAEDAHDGIYDVRRFGAVGDGKALDTKAINAAIEACSNAGGGQVRLSPGRYLSGTLRLKSHVTLYLDAGARLVGTPDLTQYERPKIPAFMPESRFGGGKWSRGLLIADGVEDVTICGPGTIDGNKVFDPSGEERMRGPHTLIFVESKNFRIRDVTIVDSANYALLFFLSDDVEVKNATFIGGWDGVHFRGLPDRPCRDVRILGCQFYTGDDAIAGRYWDDTLIADCVINSSCNGIRVIGPAKKLLVKGCLFPGPGRQPQRASRGQQPHMLSGIILQPGAWDRTSGALDDVLLADNAMHDVASPVTVWTKRGNTVGRVTVSGLRATGVYRSAISVEGWGDEPIGHVVLRDIDVEFAGGGTAEQAQNAVRGPSVDVRPLPAWGVYARNVDRLTLEDVRLRLTKDDARPVIQAEDVKRLTLDGVRYPKVEGVAQPVVTSGNTSVDDGHTRSAVVGGEG